MKKKFENFLKQLGDSPKKKRNISANVSKYLKLRPYLLAKKLQAFTCLNYITKFCFITAQFGWNRKENRKYFP
jgi:hypothetical protein